MKKFSLIVLALAFVVVPNAFAQTCPTAPSGLHCIGSYCWYEYTPDASCVSASGNLMATNMWCYNTPSWGATTGSGLVSYTFTATTNLANWSADAFIEFADPNNSWNNAIIMWAGVTHNGTTTWTQLWSWDGTQGWLSCDRNGGSFSAVQGDDITIEMYTWKANNNTTIEVSRPNIFNTF